MRKYFYIFIALLIHVSLGNTNDHQIRDLPFSRNKIPFRHYSGTIPLNGGERMFYWYVESKENPEKDPIVLWLNGGPGCSSLGGFFTENGPFVVRKDITVEHNPYSWNRKANIVYLESPAGVGFSTPQRESSFYNDETTTQNTHEFLRHFFNKYPSLKNREFYITGESYGGIYIPRLADMLLSQPIHAINFKGFAIGNPFTDNDIDGNAYMEYFYTHGLISIENYNAINKYCKQQLAHCMYSSVACTEDCSNSIQEGMKEADQDQFNAYYIYGDKCLLKNGQAGMLHFTKKKLPLPPVFRRGDIGPCTDQYTEYYLNLKEVRDAIHVGENHVHWSDCNDRVGEIYHRTPSALPYYKRILNKGLRVLIYSGDADSVVNFIGTERWIASYGLKLPIVQKWKSWFGPDDQLAGYEQIYKGLTFKTVKGAGHMVPAIKPLHALNMFECFIYDGKCDFEYPRDIVERAAGDPKETLQQETSSFGFYPLIWCILGIAGMGILMFALKKYVVRRQYQPITAE